MDRLLILSCFLLSYFVNINTLSKNDEIEVGFRDLFDRALPQNDAMDSDQTSVVYRQPRNARCLKCNNYGLPLGKPQQKQEPNRKSLPEPVPEHKLPLRSKSCLRCGKILPVATPWKPPPRRPPPLRKPCSLCTKPKQQDVRGFAQEGRSRAPPDVLKRIRTMILKWLKFKNNY